LAFSENLWSEYWWIAILVFYYLFAWVSTTDHIQSWIFYLAALFGMVIECLGVAGVGKTVYDFFHNQNNTTVVVPIPGTNETEPQPEGIQSSDWVTIVPLALLILVMFVPLLSTCLADTKTFTRPHRSSFWYVITSGLAYFLFLPTLVAVFGAFATARLFDFTWGNRDSGGATDKLGPRLQELQQRAKLLSPFIVFLNSAFVFLLADLQEISPHVLVTMSFLLFAPPMIQFFWSFMYFFGWWSSYPCRNCNLLNCAK
jgi:hypothetical protein